MKRISLSFAFSQSFAQIARTALMSLAALLTLSGALLVLGSVGLLHFNVNENLADLTTDGQAVLFLQSDCTDEEIEQMQALLENYRQDGVLSDIEYVSKEEALRSEMERFEEYPQLFRSLQAGDNPYRASFEISAAEKEKLPSLLESLQKVTFTRTDESGASVSFAPIATVVSHKSAISAVNEVMSGIRTAALVLLAILLLLSLFVLMNTVRLAIFGRRRELAVMRYVGATDTFMTAPFLTQGAVIGFCAAGLSFAVQWLLYQTLTDYLAQQYQTIALLPFSAVWYYLLAAFLFVGLLVGFASGLLATGRYLHEKD